MGNFKIYKNSNFTIMGNFHLREKNMTLKAKGILSLMLSLPKDWDYSIAGLVTLSKDGKDSVISALKELEEFGYLTRKILKNSKGQFDGYEYIIREEPYSDNLYSDKQYSDNPYAENPNSDNLLQLNNNIINNNKEQNNKLINNRENKEYIDKSIYKKKRENEFDSIIEIFLEKNFTNSNFDDKQELVKVIYDFIEHRKKIKKPLTERALNSNISKALSLSDGTIRDVINIIDNSIAHGWQGIYKEQEFSSQFNNKSSSDFVNIGYNDKECAERLKNEVIPF